MVEDERAKWSNPIEFILTVIGFAVGLGAVWRFPYLVFINGGGTFIIIFFLMLFLVGIPIFFMELSLGQFSGLGPSHAFYRISPISQGVGYAGLMISGFIGFYYNVIIAYSIYYLSMSLRAKLPWSSCNNEWNTPDCVSNIFPLMFKANPKSPSEEYFYRKVLNLSDGIGNLGHVEAHLAIALLVAWTVVFLALSKGVQSLGKVSYFTATFPYIMLTILIVAGSLLEGAGEGMKFYIGSINTKKFIEPAVWKDASAMLLKTVQIFYALSNCQGGLIAMSSMNPFKNNLLRDTFLVPILDCLTGLFAGFAIFTVLGYMFVSKCAKRFEDVVAGGPELAFIVYPEGISLMKAVPPLFSVLFFLMMLALGFGSEFSFIETIMIMILDIFKKFLNTRKKELIMRFCVCLVFFLLGLCMTTRGGFFILSLINEYTAGYPLLIIGVLEVIIIPWIYGCDRLIRDIECMIGPKPKWFWMIWKISWKFICPVVLMLVIIATAVFGSNPLEVNHIGFPGWAHGIGWMISASPILVIIGCAIYQMYAYKCDWKRLFQPDDSYYDNYRRYLQSQAGAEVVESSNGMALPDIQIVNRLGNKVIPLATKHVDSYINDSYIDDER